MTITPEQFKKTRERFERAALAIIDGDIVMSFNDTAPEMINRFEGGSNVLAKFTDQTPNEVAEFLTFALDDMRASIVVIDILQGRLSQANAEIKQLKHDKNYSANCAIMCDDGAFKAFLTACHELPRNADKDAIETRVRSLLNIKSRSELNTDPAATQRWKSLRADFEQWRKR